MNEPYFQVPEGFNILNLFKKPKSKVVEPPHDFKKGIRIKEWQLEIPYDGGSIKECFEKRFTELQISSFSASNTDHTTPDTITMNNGLVIHFEVIDRNISFRK